MGVSVGVSVSTVVAMSMFMSMFASMFVLAVVTARHTKCLFGGSGRHGVPRLLPWIECGL